MEEDEFVRPISQEGRQEDEQHTPFDYRHFVDLSEEAKRLERQRHFLYRFTRRLFETAGITTGMKVLDVGSGAGDVALLVAELVGRLLSGKETQ